MCHFFFFFQFYTAYTYYVLDMGPYFGGPQAVAFLALGRAGLASPDPMSFV
jgi:hypothetical protein